MRNCGIVLLAGLALAATAGCGGGRGSVQKADVSGTVTLDGQPVEGVTVFFVGDGLTGTGVTSSDGTYSLVTGAAVGENLIYFKPVVDADATDTEGMDDYMSEMGAGDGLPGSSPAGGSKKVPAKFQDPTKSNIKYTVPSGERRGR